MLTSCNEQTCIQGRCELLNNEVMCVCLPGWEGELAGRWGGREGAVRCSRAVMSRRVYRGGVNCSTMR